jgi:hypothetical protein
LLLEDTFMVGGNSQVLIGCSGSAGVLVARLGMSRTTRTVVWLAGLLLANQLFDCLPSNE